MSHLRAITLSVLNTLQHLEQPKNLYKRNISEFVVDQSEIHRLIELDVILSHLLHLLVKIIRTVALLVQPRVLLHRRCWLNLGHPLGLEKQSLEHHEKEPKNHHEQHK